MPTWGIEPQSWQCCARTRRPQLACVQDIRPHVPELGCTSAVQNEKMYFSFCTAAEPGACVCVNHKLSQAIPPVGDPTSQARCLDLQIHEYHEYKVLPAWGIRPQVGSISAARTRRPQRLACVQDIRPHVPELGCTSAVQNEKCIFHFCTAARRVQCLEHKLWGDASPRRRQPHKSGSMP